MSLIDTEMFLRIYETGTWSSSILGHEWINTFHGSPLDDVTSRVLRRCYWAFIIWFRLCVVSYTWDIFWGIFQMSDALKRMYHLGSELHICGIIFHLIILYHSSCLVPVFVYAVAIPVVGSSTFPSTTLSFIYIYDIEHTKGFILTEAYLCRSREIITGRRLPVLVWYQRTNAR